MGFKEDAAAAARAVSEQETRQAAEAAKQQLDSRKQRLLMHFERAFGVKPESVDPEHMLATLDGVTLCWDEDNETLFGWRLISKCEKCGGTARSYPVENMAELGKQLKRFHGPYPHQCPEEEKDQEAIDRGYQFRTTRDADWPEWVDVDGYAIHLARVNVITFDLVNNVSYVTFDFGEPERSDGRLYLKDKNADKFKAWWNARQQRPDVVAL